MLSFDFKTSVYAFLKRHVQLGLGHLDQLDKGLGVVDGHVGQELAVDLDAG